MLSGKLSRGCKIMIDSDTQISHEFEPGECASVTAFALEVHGIIASDFHSGNYRGCGSNNQNNIIMKQAEGTKKTQKSRIGGLRPLPSPHTAFQREGPFANAKSESALPHLQSGTHRSELRNLLAGTAANRCAMCQHRCCPGGQPGHLGRCWRQLAWPG